MDYFFAAKAASKATLEAAKSCDLIIFNASGAPHSRFIPLSSHSMESGPAVPKSVQGADQAIPFNIPMPGRNKVPAAAKITEIEVTSKDAVSYH